MFAQKTEDVVKAAAPVLARHGYAIIPHFCRRGRPTHPPVKSFRA